MGGVTFTYDADGLRTGKTSSSKSTAYYALNGKYVGEKTVINGTTYYISYYYDENGAPMGINVNGSAYFFVKNLQGDITAIMSYTGTVVAKYTYDAWGKLLSVRDGNNANVTSATHIANLNPFRYRGYIYDTETGLYYLNSRYYDASVGRFISPDGQLAGVGGELLGYNMYAYCFNNPINMTDETGAWPWDWATKLVAAVAVVAVVAVVAAVCVTTCGAGSVVAAAAVGAAKGAAVGFAVGAASGAAIGYATTGTLEGTLNGMADGALSGAISGTISGGISGGAKAISQNSSRVLWSGGETAKSTAASYAKSIGGTTLEQTPKGKLLTGLTKTFGYERTAPLWEKASLEFASTTRGNVTAIVSQSGYRGAGSVLNRIEYPMVASRILDG